jgi:hypothetical protein
MTVNFREMSNKTHGAYCNLEFSADFGSGAAGVATDPGGCDGPADPLCEIPPQPVNGECVEPPEPQYQPSNRGPLTGVLLTNPGSCYAKLGRVAPELTAAAGGEISDATFTVSATQHEDSEGFHYWKVSSISVSGGEGYYHQSELTISHSVGDTKVTQATAKVNTNADGVPVSVTITEAGKYYRESKDAQPYVAEVTVTPCGFGGVVGEIPPCPPSYGKEECDDWPADYIASISAQITATVNDDPYDEKFGQIESLTITKGGSNYLAWKWKEVCLVRSNMGRKGGFVVRAKTPTELVSISPIDGCYGGGACAKVIPLGDRRRPEVCVTGDGTGGTITAEVDSDYENEDDNPWKPYWLISKVTASGGSGYTDGSAAVVTFFGPPPSTTVEEQVVVELSATPKITDPQTGATSGGVLTGATVVNGGKFYIQEVYRGNQTPIKEIELVNKGSGYAKKPRIEPEVTAVATGTAGAGATFTPTLSVEQDDCGVDYWYVSSVSVSGGGGYETGAALSFAVQGDGVAEEPAEASLVAAPSDGVDGVPTGVNVANGGKYYLEDDKGEAYVADITIDITQIPPSNGSGAEFEADVETNPSSPDFGKIKKLRIKNGGSGYSLWGGPTDCEYEGPCGVTLRFRGINKEPEVEYNGAVFRADDPLVDCNNPPPNAPALHSVEHKAEASISRGGIWDPYERCACSGGGTGGNCTPLPPPTNCEQATGSSVPPCPPCRGECSECRPCAPGCKCYNGNCEPCEGPCSESSECGPGCRCENGRCVGDACGGTPCTTASDCPDCYTCKCEGGVCVEDTVVGTPCTGNAQGDCPDGYWCVGDPGSAGCVKPCSLCEGQTWPDDGNTHPDDVGKPRGICCLGKECTASLSQTYCAEWGGSYRAGTCDCCGRPGTAFGACGQEVYYYVGNSETLDCECVPYHCPASGPGSYIGTKQQCEKYLEDCKAGLIPFCNILCIEPNPLP